MPLYEWLVLKYLGLAFPIKNAWILGFLVWTLYKRFFYLIWTCLRLTVKPFPTKTMLAFDISERLNFFHQLAAIPFPTQSAFGLFHRCRQIKLCLCSLPSTLTLIPPWLYSRVARPLGKCRRTSRVPGLVWHHVFSPSLPRRYINLKIGIEISHGLSSGRQRQPWEVMGHWLQGL